MKGRKRGCPTNIRDWKVEILDPADDSWKRINGLDTMTYTIDSNTEDGSAATDEWAEPYVTKRNGSMTLEGKPRFDAVTGDQDDGQALLDSYKTGVGCTGDATLRFTDAYGHRTVADYIVTSTELSSNETEDSVSWDLEQVGEAEVEAYISVTGVKLYQGQEEVSTLSLAVGDAPALIKVKVEPATASNGRYRYTSTGRKYFNIGNVTEEGFTITALRPGSGKITVTTVNGSKTAEINVTVTQ